MSPESPENMFQFESPDDSSGFLLWQVAHVWQRSIKAGLEPLALTHVQFVLLAGVAWLGRNTEPVTQVMLATHARTDVMMTSKVLRTLEQKGLIKRAPHATDTRAKSLVITPAGHALLLKAVEIVDEIDHEFFSILGDQLPVFNASMLKLLLVHRWHG